MLPVPLSHQEQMNKTKPLILTSSLEQQGSEAGKQSQLGMKTKSSGRQAAL